LVRCWLTNAEEMSVVFFADNLWIFSRFDYRFVEGCMPISKHTHFSQLQFVAFSSGDYVFTVKYSKVLKQQTPIRSNAYPTKCNDRKKDYLI